MTVIAWDGHTLAADKQTSLGGAGFKVSKLHRTAQEMWGAAGDSSLCREMAAWIRAGRVTEDLPERFISDTCSVLLVERGGTIKFYDCSAAPTIIEEPRFAIGSGCDFALGAMYAGGDARQAVAAASRYSNSCGRGIDTMSWSPI